MGLNNQQKKYIKRNIHNASLSDLAKALGLEEKEVLEHLKKKWKPKKFKNYLSQNKKTFGVEKISNEKGEKFKFLEFFEKNKPIFLLLFVAILVSYFNSLNNGLVSDDIFEIVDNPRSENLVIFLR